MWQQQPDYARYKEKLNGEGWLLNRQEEMLIQIKPDSATKHAQFVLLSYYRLSARLGKSIRQQRMLSTYQYLALPRAARVHQKGTLL